MKFLLDKIRFLFFSGRNNHFVKFLVRQRLPCVQDNLHSFSLFFFYRSDFCLGSLFSLIPAGMIVGLFVLRTSWEDRTLQRELPGYADYAATTPWKLIPKPW